MKKKYISALIAILLVSAVAIALYSRYFDTLQYDFFAMDTYNTLTVSGFGKASVADKIESEVYDLDVLSFSRQSENSVISDVNKNHGGLLSDEFTDYFKTMIDIWNSSGKKYDFTLGAVSDLWGFGSEPHIPDSDGLSDAVSRAGADKLTLEGNKLSFPDGVIIDFGSVGKGIALDIIRDKILKNSHISKCVVSLGGSVLTYGNREFRVAVNAPLDAGNMAVLKMTSGCVSTSGTYERFFEQGGKKYHHILNPETGYPVDNGLVSVTVISDSGMLSDALSTACLICGLKDGIALAEKYGCDAVFVDSNKNVYVTNGFSGNIEITNNSYVLNNEKTAE